jgi:hypothetical protein
MAPSSALYWTKELGHYWKARAVQSQIFQDKEPLFSRQKWRLTRVRI